MKHRLNDQLQIATADFSLNLRVFAQSSFKVSLTIEQVAEALFGAS
jgi:hypothetical protein